MCGIAGEVAVSARAEPDAAARVGCMIAAMIHRGPDDVGYRTGEGAALGMCRLSIIDVAGGAQPISTANGRYHIVYNGECYGVDSLRRQLASRGCVFLTQTDTEVVLNAFVEFGPKGLERLNGMFSLAIWDAKERELFLARDRLGIKPLFLWQSHDRLVFSSTLGAIRAHPNFSGTIDPEAVELFLSVKFVTAPRTILREVRKLPAGHWARWSQGKLTIKQWWDVPLVPNRKECDLEEVAEKVTALLTDATGQRLVSERPVGLCLSGGIDSGLLASALADLGGESVETFSLGFAENSYDESGVAARVAKHLGLRHHILKATMDAERDFVQIMDHYDEPVGDSSGMALFVLSRLIAKHVTVVLSGTGGDELFGGYLRYVGSRMARFARYLPGLEYIPALLKLLGRDESKTGWRGKLARLTEVVGVPPIESYQRFLSPTSPNLDRQLRTPDFRRALGGFCAGQIFAEKFNHAGRNPDTSLLTRLMYTDMKTVLVDDYLVKEDRMTMAHSIEGRVPFLDHRLVELAYSLPDGFKIRGLQTKRILRTLANKRLPTEVVHAPKQGFEIPAARWLRGPLSERLRQTLDSANAHIFEYVERRVVTRMMHEHQSEQADHARALWSLLTLETWLNTSPDANRNCHS